MKMLPEHIIDLIDDLIMEAENNASKAEWGEPRGNELAKVKMALIEAIKELL